MITINEYFMTKFFLLEIFDMNTSKEIRLYFEFDWMDVKACNFNTKVELILFCIVQSNFRWNYVNLICVYSIETKNKLKTKCQKVYRIPEEAELISITRHDKIWLRQKNNLYEWDL